jgi:hypothetical protein
MIILSRTHVAGAIAAASFAVRPAGEPDAKNRTTGSMSVERKQKRCLDVSVAALLPNSTYS